MISKATKQIIFKRDEYKCRYCGIQLNDMTAQIDHIVPRAKGGNDEFDNLSTSCAACNAMKSNRDLSDFVTTPISKQVARTWLKAYVRYPKPTAVISILLAIIMTVSLIYRTQTDSDSNLSDRINKTEFSSQISELVKTQESLDRLQGFVIAQKNALVKSQQAIETLRNEKNRLEPLVNSNRTIVDALFKEQEIRNRRAQDHERWIGFWLGVVSSIFASAILYVVRYFAFGQKSA